MPGPGDGESAGDTSGLHLSSGHQPRPDLANVEELTSDLERFGRALSGKARELDYNRQYLRSIRAEQDLAYAHVARIIPTVQETYRSLVAAIQSRESGAAGPDIAEVAATNTRALQELQQLVGSLNIQAALYLHAWDQYSASAEDARRMCART
jgi:hypothetical protein